MKIVIAPDSFKESLSALQVAEAIETGMKQILPDAEYIKVPMADGGEGTVQSLADALGGKIITVSVTDPLGGKCQASFAISGDGQTAVIEMASASGLHLVPPDKRNPLYTTSYGTGEVIREALNLGVKKIILGIGGSATNDGGAGMLQALGVELLDEKGQPIGRGGASLAQLHRVNLANIDARLKNVAIEVACDVDNPLCGERGASAVFGPQKGATPEMVIQLDKALAHFAEISLRDTNIDIAHRAGTGAAGGMGGGLLLLPQIELRSGVQIVIDAVKLAEKVRDADLVITGEGRMDKQSIYGKTPIGVAKIAKQFNKPVIAIVGCLREDFEVVYEHGIDAVFPIIRQLGTLEETLKSGADNLKHAGRNIAKVYSLSK